MPPQAVIPLVALAVVVLAALFGLQWIWLAWRLDRLELLARGRFRRRSPTGPA